MKEKEEERLKLLKEYETNMYVAGIKYIAGIDEAGRGPLARSCCCWSMYNAKKFLYRRSK